MVTKILVGIGFILILLGGGLYLTQQNALQMAATSFRHQSSNTPAKALQLEW